MKGRLVKAVFWALIAVFIGIVSLFIIPVARDLIMGGVFLIASGVLLLSLGGALVYLAAKKQAGATLKKFFILTGACAAGIPISAVLHNAVYGVFIHFFGDGFWERTGMGDEPFFFVLAIVVFPLGFLAGAAGSIFHLAKSPD